MIKKHLFGWSFLAGVIVSGLAVWGYAVLHTVIEEARTDYCTGVLKHVGLAFTDYRQRHAGAFPKRLDESDETLLGTYSFSCPAAPRLGRRAYLFLPPREGASDETPIVFCWHHPDLLILT